MILKHDSLRGYFAFELYRRMLVDPHIYVLTGDLGYAMFDNIREDFSDRFINCGASEQAMMGIACGMALAGKLPIVYSITTFLLFRPFETIRNYIDHEKIPVKLVGSGREKDYAHDGYSHWPLEEGQILSVLSNINTYYPDKKSDITEDYLSRFLYSTDPSYMSLHR